MASYPETKRLEELIPEIYSLKPILDELTKTYCGDPIFLVEIEELIETLSDIDQAIIYLRYFGLSLSEIAKELNLSKRRIKQRIKKLRERARGYIG